MSLCHQASGFIQPPSLKDLFVLLGPNQVHEGPLVEVEVVLQLRMCADSRGPMRLWCNQG